MIKMQKSKIKAHKIRCRVRICYMDQIKFRGNNMNNFINNTFKDLVKLVLANLGILLVWQMIFFAVYKLDSDSGIVAIIAVYGIVLFAALIYSALIWSVVSIIPSLIGFLLYRNFMDKSKKFMGCAIATLVMVGIYDVVVAYIYISMLASGFNVWLHLIPVVISVIILIQTIIKVNNSYKNIATNTYMGGNTYLANEYNYGYGNTNYNQMNPQNYSNGNYNQPNPQYYNNGGHN